MTEFDFDAVRPYSDEELQASIPRMMADPKFTGMIDYLFDSHRKKAIFEQLPHVKTINEFQRVLTLPAVEKILDDTTDGIQSSGYENISVDDNYIFIANHRDIILDSSILGLSQLSHGHRVTQTTWGNNLMINQLIIDLGKSNQMITVFREGSPKELLLNSQRLSAFLRYSLTELKNSIWIAQRKGRTKDGSDKTDVTILKMLSLSCGSNFIESMQELNITPLTISYEWEPCDAMKVREIYLSQQETYIKEPDEDFNSILGGVLAQKGRVHLAIGTTLNNEIEKLKSEQLSNNGVLAEIAKMIDHQIHLNYHLWPSNYLAYDLLHESNLYSHLYTEETLNQLNKRYERTSEIIGHNNNDIRTLFIKVYANPVINKLLALNGNESADL
jgi:hypothetical protein